MDYDGCDQMIPFCSTAIFIQVMEAHPVCGYKMAGKRVPGGNFTPLLGYRMRVRSPKDYVALVTSEGMRRVGSEIVESCLGSPMSKDAALD